MSTFQTLPQEVLDNILEPLYITDQISLRLTCRTLYLRSPPFVDLYTVLHGHGYTTEAMMLSLVLERDMKPEYRVCGRCHRLHRTHFFEPAELGKSDAWSRACTGKKSFAVLDPLACENKDTPFWKIKGIREELEENMGAGARKNDDMQVKRWYEGEEHGIGGKIWPPEQNEREIFYGLNASRERQRMAYTRNYLGPSGAENRVDSKDQGVQLMVWMDRKHFFLAQDGRGGNDLIVATVWYLDLEAICGPLESLNAEIISAEILRQDLDFPICPHMRLDDTRLCMQTMMGLGGWLLSTGVVKRNWCVKCEDCSTTVRFMMEVPQQIKTDTKAEMPQPPPSPCMKMTILKNLGKLKLAIDQSWLAHSTMQMSTPSMDLVYS